MMKKIFCILLCLVIVLTSFPLSTSAEAYSQEDALTSPNIAVYNTEKERFVYLRNADERIQPSSTAKLMTGILALEYFEGRLDTKITVPKAALRGLQGTSVLNLKAEEEISAKDLIYAMLVAGMNDAANVLAIEIAGSTLEFAKYMTEKARALGAGQTNYSNPTGFDDITAYTTAADTALIAAYAYQNKLLMEIVSTRAYTVSATNMHEAVTVYTRNSLLTPQSDYYYKNAKGMLSGYTDVGGYAVIAAASHGTYPYVCVAMGAPSLTTGAVHAYTDTKNLLSWASGNFLERKILDASKIMAELPVLAGKQDHVLIVPGETIYAFLDADADLSSVTYSVELDYETLTAPVQKGAIVGYLLAVLDGEPIGGAHLVTKTDIRQDKGDAFLLGLKNIVTHPVFIILLILFLILTAFFIYRKYFYPRKPIRSHKKDRSNS